MKTYRISEANLTSPEGVVVLMEFGQAGRHEVLLSEAASYIRQTQGISGRVPTRVSLTDGRKVGAFPCVIAKTELAAEAMSAILGYEIVVGDGVRCATQLQARELYLTLHRRYCIPTKDLGAQWMMSPPEPTLEQATTKKPQRFSEEEYQLQFQDSPF